MTFIESIKTCFKKFADFTGRAPRSEFWWFQLFTTVAVYGAMTLDHLLLGYSFDDLITPLAIITIVVVIVPTASVAARRLHDIGWSGWIQLPVFATYSAYLDIWIPGFSVSATSLTLMTIGMLSWVVLLLILIRDGQRHTNKYGPDPKSDDMGEVFS